MIEEWRDVKGYEGLYQVSSIGRVKALPYVRDVKYSNGRAERRRYKERDRKAHKNMHGYMVLPLSNGGSIVNKQVHRLVAEAFIPNPEGKEQVNHKNGEKDDNRVENLEWVSRYENSIHAVYTLGHIGQFKCKPVRCKETGVVYPSIEEAARQTSCPASCIGAIANKKVRNGKHAYTTHGLSWEFC